MIYNKFMLIDIQSLLGANVMSLQTGQPLAKLLEPIVDPRNLKIVAFYVAGPMVDFAPAVLFSEDIREFGRLGAIVNSGEQILPLDENLVRLQEIIDLGFQLEGILVVDEQKHKLGKVENYTLVPENFVIQQLYVRPTLMKSLSVAHLTVGRDQIVAIDNQKITVKTPTVKEEKLAGSMVKNLGLGDFENPFRKPKAEPAPARIETSDLSKNPVKLAPGNLEDRES